MKNIIKVPVYCTEPQNYSTYSEMIDFLQNLIKRYEDKSNNLEYPKLAKRGREKTTYIEKIEEHRMKFGDRDILLINITSYDENLGVGCYVSTENGKTDFADGDKIYSFNNFMLAYPVIEGSNSPNNKSYFLFFIYDDFRHEQGIVPRICKHVCTKVLSQKMKNIKLDKVIDEIKSCSKIEALKIVYSSVKSNSNGNNEYRDYLVSEKIKKEKTDCYKDIPSVNVIDLLERDESEYEFVDYVLPFKKKKIKLSRKIVDGKMNLAEEAELSFNEEVEVKDKEINDLYNENIVFKKLSDVVTNYISEIHEPNNY